MNRSRHTAKTIIIKSIISKTQNPDSGNRNTRLCVTEKTSVPCESIKTGRRKEQPSLTHLIIKCFKNPHSVSSSRKPDSKNDYHRKQKPANKRMLRSDTIFLFCFLSRFLKEVCTLFIIPLNRPDKPLRISYRQVLSISALSNSAPWHHPVLRAEV